MYDAASSILAQKLSQVQGVGQVIVGGGALPAVRVDVNPTVLNQLGLGLDDVRTALAAANANRPKGFIADDHRTWSIGATDQLRKASEYRPLIVAYKSGAAVRLSDIAAVTDTVEDIHTAGLYNGKPAVSLIIFRQPGANIIDTVDRVQGLMPLLQAEIPQGMRLAVVMDRTATIRASVKDVEITLGISISLVIFVVFLFLRDWRTTLIPSVVVPVSLVGTFGVMYLCGYSIDNLSLMALTIATGFVVDDAIVVIENITRYLEQGMSPTQAAFKGAAEIGFTVLSISVSLVAVFIPILLMGGIVGRLFREFAVTLSVAIGLSMVISLTTTPMMCALLLRHRRPEQHGRTFRASERVFQFILHAYERTLAVCLRHPLAMLIVTLLTIALSVILYVKIPRGFFPQQDTGRMMGNIDGDQSASFQMMRGLLGQYVETICSDPGVDNVIAFTGGGNVSNTARMFIALKPLEQRKVSADTVINRLRGPMGRIPGGTGTLQPVQDVRAGGRMARAQYQYTLQGDDLAELYDWAPKVLAKMRTLKGLADLNSTQQVRGRQSSIAIDRATAARLGITAQMIDEALYDAFGQRQVSTIYTQLNQYHVVLEVQDSFAQGPEGLKQVYLRSNTGGRIPLSAIAHEAESPTPLSIDHQSQFPAVTISFNLLPGYSLGDAVTQIQQAAREMGLPASIQGKFQGTAQIYEEAQANQLLLIIAALATVYIILGILYESYIHPITILSTLPSAGVGALLALRLCDSELNMISLIGIILLIGIVKKNGIMMIDFALAAERNDGKSPKEAIFQACLLRFRPITMTTMAALLGGLPLALGTGTGSELRRPLGIAIVGGLIFSQMLTLYTTPVVYLYLDRLRLWFAGLRHGSSHSAAASTPEAV